MKIDLKNFRERAARQRGPTPRLGTGVLWPDEVDALLDRLDAAEDALGAQFGWRHAGEAIGVDALDRWRVIVAGQGVPEEVPWDGEDE